MKFQFKGMPALFVLLVLGGTFGVRLASAGDSLDLEARAQLTIWLQAQYAREYLATMDKENPTAADADSLLNRSAVDVVALDSRGRLDDRIVRVEIQVNGAPPPDGKATRYWHMGYSRAAGWRLFRETNALAYYLKF